MDDSPTTFNGPLQNPAADLDDRRIVAVFDDIAEARTARERLIAAGIPPERVQLLPDARADATAAAATQPPDQNIIGRIRESVWPDHGTEAYRDAARQRDPMLAVLPTAGETDTIVRVLTEMHPKHFDPRLERWRNSA